MSEYHSSGGWLSTHVKLPLNKICAVTFVTAQKGERFSQEAWPVQGGGYHQVLKGHNTFTYHLVNKIKIEHYTRNRSPIDLES